MIRPTPTRPPAPLATARLTAVAIAVVLATAACGGSDGASTESGSTGGDERPTVVVTTNIWADVVSNVACGGLVDIETLIPDGGDPHGFEPSLADRGTMERASLIVANGLSLEEGLEDTIEAVEDGGVSVFRMADHVETIAFSSHESDHDESEESDHHESEESDHDEDHHEAHGDSDPHLWFDPVRVSATLPILAAALVDETSVDEAALDTCVGSYQAELEALDVEIRALTEEIPVDRRNLVTNHDSLGYFADRYRFEIIGTVIPVPSGLAEANPAQLEALAELIETTNTPAVFAESQHSDDDAAALADRVGDIEVVTLFTGTLGPSGSAADNYVGLLLTNAQRIVDALG